MRTTVRSLFQGRQGPFSYDQLLDNNKKWVQAQLAKDPQHFIKLSNSQAPPMLYVGCSDSRMPLVSMTGSRPGDMLVHRNVANLVLAADTSLLSVLALAVDIIKVQHIVICGHTDCAGVKTALEDRSGLIGNWVADIRHVYLQHRKELDAIKDYRQRVDRLSELNVLRQVQNLCRTYILRHALADNCCPTLHGWIVEVGTGTIKELPIPWHDWVEKGMLPDDWLKVAEKTPVAAKE
eukprot:TRINITY_DN25378_c0_g1_i1.p1 TRINITY_DN25378_c0_g1~~TRINITY_DN25378_c0_g1_i1.p1  ORF type:complete len:246 (+),score=35.30 TRINITY_DN25378_c0_g1_i1:33-740(+)